MTRNRPERTKAKSEYVAVGGQALIEGIMMRGPKKTAVAVRRSDGSIWTESYPTRSFKDKHKWAGLPVIRGVVGYVESLTEGSKALMRSADVAAEEIFDKSERAAESETASEAESADSAQSADSAAKPAKKAKAENKEPFLYSLLVSGSVVLGVVLAVFLFMYCPAKLFNFLNARLGGGLSAFRALFEGVVKIELFLIYLWAVAFMPDIKRVFMYHGAEHKTIFALEAGMELTPENVRTRSRFHPRCGTSFLVIILAVSVLTGTVVSMLFPALARNALIWTGVRLLLLPLVAGLGYECIRFCGRKQNRLTRILSAPGMWVQRLTTKEPDDSMIEVGIAALKAVLPEADGESA